MVCPTAYLTLMYLLLPPLPLWVFLIARPAVLGLAPAKANALRPPSPLIPPPPASPRPFLWEVLMSDPPQMQPYTSTGEKAVLKVGQKESVATLISGWDKRLTGHEAVYVQDLASTCCAVFLGEHFDKPEDNQLQVTSNATTDLTAA